MKKLTKEEIKKLKKELGLKQIDMAGFISFLQSLPKDKAKEIMDIWVKSNTEEFPKLAKLMIKKGLLTQKEFDKDWNHRDMYEIFMYTLNGTVQDEKKKGNKMIMTTVSKFKLKKKKQIKKKFGVIIADPEETMEMMKKEDPEKYKEFEREIKFQEQDTNYIG